MREMVIVSPGFPADVLLEWLIAGVGDADVIWHKGVEGVRWPCG